ncbi:MAG: BTAD domain-containing putative transcriptional regulator [Acidimicrobiia bacterium]
MTARNDGEVQGLREHRAARWWLVTFVVVVTAMLVPSGRALAIDQAMEPNSILAAESFVGDQMTAPEDGRLRGYGFAATVTSTGTADGATRLLSTFGPAAGQRLVAFSLRFDLLRGDNDTSHPVRATLVVDGRRSALDDGDFVSSGERMYAASVPRATTQVDLEMSAAGLAQAFSLTEGHRVGDQPVVLYRDPAGPDVISDVNDERTLSATSATDGAKGAVSIALNGARLSYFSPGEPITTAGSPSRAFLIVEGIGDGVQPPYGSADYGRYFSGLAALPGGAVKARLPDGSEVEARHAGSDEGLLGGWYYFSVPADLASVRITIEPGTVDGSQYRGFVGQPARITIDGEASFDMPFGAPAAPSPSRVTAAPASPVERQPENLISQEEGSWPMAPLLAGLTAALLVAGMVGVRQKRRAGGLPGVLGPTLHSAKGEDATARARAEAAKPERVLDIAGTEIALEGPGAEGAARAAIVEALVHEGGPLAVVVLATGRTANLLPAATDHHALRLAKDEEGVLRELEVVNLQQCRLTLETEEAGEQPPSGPADVLVVAPGPLEPRVRLRLDSLNSAAPRRSGGAVICLGGDHYPLLVVDERGGISASGEHGALRCVPVMTAAEAAAALAGPTVSPPGLSDVAAGQPADAAEAATRQRSAVISVRLLGPYRITVGDSEVASGLRAKARELLAYLAVNREGVTMDAAIEALWRGADPDKSPSYFRTVVANLRTTLRTAAGLDQARAVVERVGPRYRLDPGLVVVDLWQFLDGVAGPTRDGIHPSDREVAADVYGGEFAAGEDFPWAEPIREQLRRKAIENLTALAESRRATGDFDGALRATERAIEFDPYGEELYRMVIDLEMSLGRRDAASRTLRLLEQRLADLDLRPQEATRRLLSQDFP